MSRLARIVPLIRFFVYAVATSCICFTEKAAVASEPPTTTAEGSLIWTRYRTDMLLVKFPALKETVVHRTRSGGRDLYPTIHSISGPDLKGRIAYIEDHFFDAEERNRRHELKVIDLPGKEQSTLFSRPGSAMWAATRAGKGEIGSHIAMSATTGKVAILTQLTEKQMPRALLHQGRIEIWDIEKKRGSDTEFVALDRGLSWFPDGRRLAYVRLVDRKSLAEDTPGLTEFGNYFGESWEQVPAAHIADAATGEVKLVSVGWDVVAPNRGESVAIGGWDRKGDFRWVRKHLKTGKVSPLSFANGPTDVVAIMSDRLILYEGRSDDKSPPDRTASGRDYRATINLADLESGLTEVVVKDFDASEGVSFGRMQP